MERMPRMKVSNSLTSPVGTGETSTTLSRSTSWGLSSASVMATFPPIECPTTAH